MMKSLLGQLTIDGSESKHYLILFLLWPFMAFLVALKNYEQKVARKVVYLFLIYYGLNFVIGQQAMDSSHYASKLQATASIPTSDFFRAVGGLYSHDSSVDIYEPLVTFLVSRFTSDYRVLFAIFAAVFGFFYLKSINLLYKYYQQTSGLNALIFFILFIVTLPITTINGVRMWTAAWIFFYGAIHVILYRDYRYLLVALTSSFVHFSFISANIILFIYFFAGNRNFIYFPIVIVSFILPNFISQFLNTISLSLGGGIQNRVEGYTSEGYVESVQEFVEQAAWFVTLRNDMIFYYLQIAVLIIFIVYINLMI
jgi:hypothetical protein